MERCTKAFYSSASSNSLWRGVNYYKERKVRSFTQCDEGFCGVVEGSDNAEYDVRINLSHPRKSSCSCPFAKDRRVICKHMIALYFTSVPDSYEAFEYDIQQLEVQYKLEEERWQKETLARIKDNVSKMSAKEVRAKLVDMLYQAMLEDRYRDDDWW